ncbi:hypothetical protein EIP91_006458 [Steccherinum ochraceum]|uniref:JmjC domain-containing protein n=1 Tax=Steccherinum ochraceum TaxID=92696 RepID=A0A4R0R8C9_9APHY|nr:hypothetical protein EIP91_006458 [Steccherinum ochraceum]
MSRKTRVFRSPAAHPLFLSIPSFLLATLPIHDGLQQGSPTIARHVVRIPPSPAMNTLHDQGHKRTSINELLNPVAAAPSQHLETHPAYSSAQLPAIAPYLPHQQHVASSGAYSPSSIHNSFSLRAANWENGTGDPMARRHDANTAQNCTYTPSVPQNLYANQHYPRQAPRSVDETQPAYGNSPTAWPGPHEAQAVALQFGQPMMATAYTTDDRTGEVRPFTFATAPAVTAPPNSTGHPNDPNSKTYTPPPHPQPQPPQYDQEVASQSFPAASAPALQTAERASVRLAARSSMPPTPMTLHPSQGAPSFYSGPQGFIAAIPIMQAPPQPMQQQQKRPLEQTEEDDSAPKSKKSRGKSKSTSEGSAGSSRRGYNAKKRNEAAQIAAQNATALVPMVPMADKDGMVGASTQLRPELQFARCMSNRYRTEDFPRCVSCTRRWAGDTCRFQGIRFFLKDDKKNIVGISFVESPKADGPSMHFPGQWNVPLKDEYIGRVKRTVAESLLPVLKLEHEHMQKQDVIRRPRESEVRATCDTCMTSIFACSWMCRLCGREACAECFGQVKELTTDKPDATEADIAALQARREKHAHVNPFFLSCTRRNEHRAADFSPMTRFTKSELSQSIEDMEALLAKEKEAPPADQVPESELGVMIDSPLLDTKEGLTGGSAQAEASTSANGDLSSFSTGTQPPLTQASPLAPKIPHHPTRYFKDTELTDEVFRRVWGKGDPLVVTGLLGKFQVEWTPEYFKTKYGTQGCLILECQSDTNKRVTVGDFFSWFGDYSGRRDCWKLKDWPPSTDFKTAFPELYEDFARATPVPNYVRRDGVMNIASHFPSNTVAPDLGPKMYNAMASFEGQGSKGSTRLHMDMADAVNIMLYASPTPDGKPGGAVWDLFKAEDAVKLRKFLRKKFKGQYQNDPIHSQTFYLDTQLRQELFDDYGIQSHRVYQTPGQAVFIPAGCAHQVCNLADCIKVASDFVSPENIERCELLTSEFREQNQSMVWKEDVLQLRTMMWFAWLSCCRQEKEMHNN